MTSVQERLQLKRIALDKWTTREQLCLASAVSCSGDQNWMSVSRSLKVICGANRPADWFSQKSCAVQYGELLENVETPKRKKRTNNERDTQIAETPTESILRKLTQERVNELKSLIKTEQEEYAKLKDEILSIQNGNTDENQLREMWAQIEQEMEQKLVEKQKHEQWLKEREERKNELQKASRMNLFQTVGSAQAKPTHLNLNIKPDDIDTDDSNSKQGTSPLLTSLLKSPATTPTASNSPTSVRVTAPTITNLLTGNANSVLSINTSSSGQGFQLIQNQPLTGPIPNETAPPIIQSPSQAAPTLSMLLENKNANKQSNNEQQIVEIKSEENSNEPEAMETEDGSCSPNKEEVQQLMEVFKGLIPDNIDEDIEEILTNNNGIILNTELLEEESILENVDSLIDDQDDMTDKNKPIDEQNPMQAESSKNMLASINSFEVKNKTKDEKEETADVKAKPKIEDSSGGGFHTNKEEDEVKKNSGTFNVDKAEEKEEKDKVRNYGTSDEKDEVQASKPNDANKVNEKEDNTSDADSKNIVKASATGYAESKLEYMPQKESSVEIVKKESRPSDQKLNSPVRKDHSSPEKKRDKDISQEKVDKNNAETEQTRVVETDNENVIGSMSDHTTTITIIDTDEDSTMEVIKEDKIGKAKRDYSRKKPEPIERRLEDIDENRLSISLRKFKERDGSESPLVDDETSDSIPRTRRRYSSTPNIDSIPSSPASSDDREYKVWKKSVLTVYNKICSHKYASMFLKVIPEESAPHYKQIILKPMDLQTIKHNIEYGIIRTTAEFQRDVLLMLQNAIMYYSKDNSTYAMAKEMVADIAFSIESLVENAKKELDHRSSISSSKNRGRKSTRLP